MEMKFTAQGTELTVTLEGRLDTTSSPELEKALGEQLGDTEHLIMEFEKLNYISSAGLRVLLGAQKKMNAKKGTMIVRHASEMVMEIFEVTGFLDILTVEKE